VKPSEPLSPSYEQTERWFAAQHWKIFDFQRAAWQAWHRGESGLIHSPTGSGKTLAAWLGPVQAALDEESPADNTLRVLWITPLRALATDTVKSLTNAASAHGLELRIEARTGDTATSVRNRQRYEPPYALVTTPESLSVMLSYKEGQSTLQGIHTVIVDEWHELLASKRGVQLELCLARIRALNPALRVWGLSATLANLELAMQCLLGPAQTGKLIQGLVPRRIVR